MTHRRRRHLGHEGDIVTRTPVSGSFWGAYAGAWRLAWGVMLAILAASLLLMALYGVVGLVMDYHAPRYLPGER